MINKDQTLTRNANQRIISLVPSITELLYDLGLDGQVVGITKFCVHPKEWYRTKPRVGGTKNVNIQAVQDHQPTLVIANKEENVKEQVEAIKSFCEVLVTDVNNLSDALEMINHVGLLTGTTTRAAELVLDIEQAFSKLFTAGEVPAVAAYLIWKDPYMVAGGNTYINNMMEHCGFSNAFSELQRYPQIDLEQIAATRCEWVLLSSEPYPFSQKHIEEMQAALPNQKIMLVDGEMFSWYGSRLLKAAEYFGSLQQSITIL